MKTVDEIYQQMLSDFCGRIGRDVSGGCDLAVRLYAVAAQVQALYAQADWLAQQCFPQTARDIYLDYHAQMRGLTRTAAVCATGIIRFSVRAAAEEILRVPAGTVCMNTLGVRYETLEEGALEPGALSVDVPSRAVEAGAAGNCLAGTIVSMSVPPAGIVRCTNPTAFTGGEDAESDEALRARILDSYRRLPNGANATFYESQAMLHPGVAAAQAVGRARGIGTVDVYVAATAGTPEEELLAEIAADLQSKREIAVDVAVKAPEERRVDVALEVRAVDYEPVRAAAESALRGYFTGERLGQAVLLSQLHALLHQVEGLENYHILAPAADVDAAIGVLPVLGAVQISPMA